MRCSTWPLAVCLTATVLATACSSDDESEQNPSSDAATTGGSSGSGTGGTGTGGSGTGGSSTGGTGTGGSATGGSGTAGGAAGAVGTAGAAGAAGAGTACEQLDACCDTTSTILRTNCRTIVATGMAAQCTAVMGIFCNGGVDGGTGDAGGGCTALQQCCAALSGAQRSNCETIAGLGNDFQCNIIASQYCP